MAEMQFRFRCYLTSDYAALLKAIQGAPHRLVFFAFDQLHLDGVED